jgi:hypothetical protein
MRPSVILPLLLIAACASAPDEPVGPPNLTAAPGALAPAQARYYADCLAAAVRVQSFDRENNTLRFHCSGSEAQRFYDGLDSWSRAHDSQLSDAGRTLRFTQRPVQDVSGLDFCWRTDAGAYGCTIVLNVGEFLSED